MLSWLPHRQYHQLNTIRVSRSALQHNFLQLQTLHPEARVAPVLKSNAYGHGLTTVAPIFDTLRAPFLVVDSLFEAYELQKLHLRTPILILGYTDPRNFAVKRLPFHFTVFDLETAHSLNMHQRCNVHIFVDTGMHREGVALEDLRAFVQQLKGMKNLHISGLASHFADADNPTSQIATNAQVQKYTDALQILLDEGIDPEWRHVSASGGALKLHDNTFNLVRAGLVSYGISPLEKNDLPGAKVLLRPALSFSSTIAQIRQLNKGEAIGYNGTFLAPRDMKIGLLPAGYYEGVDRRLSNSGVCTLGSINCPILGRVSMNMTSIDLSAAADAKVGDEVTIFSAEPSAPNTVASLAETAKTIPYELLVHLAESVRRVVVD